MLDHRKYQWLTDNQMRILLQAVVFVMKSESNKWSRIQQRFYKSMCESWRRYQNKRRIQYKRREKTQQDKEKQDSKDAIALIGDRPMRGARAEAERRLAELLPGEAGPTAVLPRLV